MRIFPAHVIDSVVVEFKIDLRIAIKSNSCEMKDQLFRTLPARLKEILHNNNPFQKKKKKKKYKKKKNQTKQKRTIPPPQKEKQQKSNKQEKQLKKKKKEYSNTSHLRQFPRATFIYHHLHHHVLLIAQSPSKFLALSFSPPDNRTRQVL